MGEPLSQPSEGVDGWPTPSPDVLRELDPPKIAVETEWPVSYPPQRLPAKG